MSQPMIAVSAVDRQFADDLEGECARCHRKVYYRPHAAAIEVTERICMHCWQPKPDDTVVTTEESVRELSLYLSTTKGEH